MTSIKEARKLDKNRHRESGKKEIVKLSVKVKEIRNTNR